MQLIADAVEVSVPATSANLGPGFDALGLAVNIRDTVVAQAVASERVTVQVEGEGFGDVPTDETHLVARALRVGLDFVGAPQVGLQISCKNAIPHGRGLGSSAAAVVAGLAAARALIQDPNALTDADMLSLATELEGHPDNAAPAILGGATVAWMSQDGGARALRLGVSPLLDPLVLIPQSRLATSRARGVLPASVPHADAAFSAGRSALLVAALGADMGGDSRLIFEATEDRLHQHYRADQMPDSYALVEALRAEGLAAVISGAGPTVLVLGVRAEREQADLIVAGVLTTLFGSAGGGATDQSWTLKRPGVSAAGVSASGLRIPAI